MRTPRHGRSPADSTPDFDGIDEQVSQPDAPWMPQQSDSAVDILGQTETAPASQYPADGDTPADSGSNVLVGSGEETSSSASGSHIHLVNGPHTHEKASGAPVLEEPRVSDSGISDGHSTRKTRKDTAVPRRPKVGVDGKRDRLLLVLLVSYASAITLACLYLLVTVLQSPSHELENLPDVEPLDKNEFRYAPENAALPPGHTLQLGEPQQFGFVLVEPLRVTREPLQFTHYSGNPKLKRAGTPPVLKLWVRFTNVSQDQVIAPLDRTLLFKRDYQEESDQLLTNNFLRPLAIASADVSKLPMFDHPLTSEWDIRDQHLGRRLKPGESVEMFLPSQPEMFTQLEGDMLWRMHIRKGFHAATGHGVTTLVDVTFDAQQIEESAAASTSSG